MYDSIGHSADTDHLTRTDTEFLHHGSNNIFFPNMVWHQAISIDVAVNEAKSPPGSDLDFD